MRGESIRAPPGPGCMPWPCTCSSPTARRSQVHGRRQDPSRLAAARSRAQRFNHGRPIGLASSVRSKTAARLRRKPVLRPPPTAVLHHYRHRAPAPSTHRGVGRGFLPRGLSNTCPQVCATRPTEALRGQVSNKPRHKEPVASVRFYEDLFVKPFLIGGIDGWHIMGPAQRRVRCLAWGDSVERCILIRGRGVTSVRASARTNFYPCRVGTPCTTCSMRAMRLDKPRLPARPIFEDGPGGGTRGRCGRVDL